MRKYLLILIITFIGYMLPAQEKTNLSNHQLSIDFGSLRNRYFYPITNIQYSSPILKNLNLKFSARFRSYGTLYFFSKSSYDLTPLLEYYSTKTIKPLYFSAGAGLDARIRLVKDERSSAKSSAEPFISIAAKSTYKKITFNTPIWVKFYANGFSNTFLPEASVSLNPCFSIYLRYELTYLKIYKVSEHEWRRDCFIGTHILF